LQRTDGSVSTAVRPRDSRGPRRDLPQLPLVDGRGLCGATRFGEKPAAERHSRFQCDTPRGYAVIVGDSLTFDPSLCVLCLERMAFPRATPPGDADRDADRLCERCNRLAPEDRRIYRDLAQLRVLRERERR
jgi:hypothetical protein